MKKRTGKKARSRRPDQHMGFLVLFTLCLLILTAVGVLSGNRSEGILAAAYGFILLTFIFLWAALKK